MNKIYQKWQTLSVKDQRALIVCIIFLLAVAIYIGLLSPLIDKYDSLIESENMLIEEKNNLLGKSNLLTRRIQKYNSQKAQYDYFIQNLNVLNPTTQSLTDALNDIEEYTDFLDLKISQIKPLSKISKDFYWLAPFEIDFEGRFTSVMKLLYYLEASPSVFVLPQINLSQKNNSLSGKLIVTKLGLTPTKNENSIQEPDPYFRFAVEPWVDHIPFFIAKEKGFLKNKNTRLHLVSSGDIYTHRKLFESSDIDGMLTNLLSTIHLMRKGVECKIIAVPSTGDIQDIMVTSKNSSIKDISNINGKSIYLKKYSISHYALYEALKKYNMTLSDVNVVNMIDTIIVQSLLAGLIEVGVVWESEALTAIKSGHIRRLYSFYDNKEKEKKKSPNKYFATIIVHNKNIKNNLKEIKLLLQGYYKALAWWKKHPEQGNLIAAKALNMTVKELVGSLKKAHYFSENQTCEIISKKVDKDNIIEKSIKNYENYFKAAYGYELEIAKDQIVDFDILKKIILCKEKKEVKKVGSSQKTVGRKKM